MTENNDKIARKIARAIRHRIKKIEDGYGYNIESSYCDKFYGEYVNVYYCDNGYEGEPWEIRDKIHEDIYKYKQIIILDGFVYGGKRYFIHGDMYLKGYYDKELVKLISEKEHLKMKKISRFLNNIKNKVIKARSKETDKILNEYRKKCSSKDSIESYNPFYVNKLQDRNYYEGKAMNKLAIHSIDAFKQSYKRFINLDENHLPFHRLVDYITDKEKEIIYYEEMNNVDYLKM